MTLRRPLLLAAITATLCDCDAPPNAPPRADAATRFACARPDEAPLPDGFGGHRCLRVGAREGLRADLWPATDGLPTPVIFVLPGAPAGGDGTRERPFADLDDALARDAATVALARGEHRLDVPWRATAARTLVGADASSTRVTLSSSANLTVEAPVALRALALLASATTASATVSVRPGASLTLDDVVIEGGAQGVAAEDADVLARHLTVRRARDVGVNLVGRSRAVLRSVLVRDGASSGLALDRAHVHLHEALFAANARKGVVLLGDPDPARGFGDCRVDDPGASTGTRDCITDVACVDDHIAALQVAGRRTAEARRLFLAGTTAMGPSDAADGLLVADGADVSLDPEVATEAMQGFGSELVGNARKGMLVDGGNRAGARSRVSIRGAVVRENALGGVFLQQEATATRVEFSRFERNRGFGLAAVPSVTLMAIGCNGFIATQPATVPALTEDGRTVTLELADGLSVNGALTLDVTNNRFTDNARFAAIFAGAGGRVVDNDGTGNRYPLGVYRSPALTVTTNRVTAREAPPATSPGIATTAP